jgi:hypothetical protein
MDCMQLILADVAKVKEHILDQANERDMTRPFSAAELCERWSITVKAESETDAEALQLHSLALRCRAYGLKPLRGTRGWGALYARADVLHAESYAAGKLSRRKHA